MKDYDRSQMTIGRIIAEKAARIPEAPWLLSGGRTWTYGELHDYTNRYANGFRQLGIGRSVHVSVLMSNCPEYFGVVWGLGKLGAVSVPLNTAARGDLLRYFIDQSDSEWIVVDAEGIDRVAELAGSMPKVKGCVLQNCTDEQAIPLAAAGWTTVHLREIEAADPVEPDHNAVAPYDPSLIMYTSGTTGPSKGVYAPHAQPHYIGRHLTQKFGYRSDDVIYTCLPLFHGNAFWYSAFPALWAEALLAISPRFSVSRFWSEIRATKATQFNALGAMINMLLKQPPSPDDRNHSVRQSMALPLSRESYAAFNSRFGITITSLYAMTETFPGTMFTPEEPSSKAASAGRPHGYGDIRIVDDEDYEVGPGEVGEICFRPNEPWSMMLNYYKMPEQTLREMKNMWFHSGDRGYLDEDGYLFFVDRKKEAIRRRGENISAYEVEMLTARHPAILEVAAIPISSELSEDDVGIFVVTKDGQSVTPEEIIDFCARNMAYFMVPRYIRFIDQLPKTSSEKIEKYKLRSWAEANRGDLWDREAHGIKVTR